MYNTDAEVIKHIYGDLQLQIMKKYKFTDEEIFTLIAAKTIMLQKAKEIEDATK